MRDPPLCALSDLCRAGAGLQGPLGPEGETAETPGTGSGREGLLPLTEQGCGSGELPVSWPLPDYCEPKEAKLFMQPPGEGEVGKGESFFRTAIIT